jgi:hypothetical protein
LLARGEREHKAATALLVISFADETARYLSRVLIARRKEAEIRPAERKRDAERLPFGDNDVGIARAGRAEQSERDGFCDGDDEQRADGVRFFGERVRVFDAAEEVWRLDDERGCLVV